MPQNEGYKDTVPDEVDDFHDFAALQHRRARLGQYAEQQQGISQARPHPAIHPGESSQSAPLSTSQPPWGVRLNKVVQPGKAGLDPKKIIGTKQSEWTKKMIFFEGLGFLLPIFA